MFSETHEAKNNENIAMYIGLCVAIAVFIIVIVIIIIVVKRKNRQQQNDQSHLRNGGK